MTDIVCEKDKLFKELNQGLNFIVAPPGCFKTIFCVSKAYDDLISGNNILYFNSEVPNDCIRTGLIARHAYEMGYDISTMDILNGEYGDIITDIIEPDFRNNVKGNIDIYNMDEFSFTSISYIESMMETFQNNFGDKVNLFYIDSLVRLMGKLSLELNISNNHIYRVINNLLSKLKDLSFRNNVKLLITCMMNKKGVHDILGCTTFNEKDMLDRFKIDCHAHCTKEITRIADKISIFIRSDMGSNIPNFGHMRGAVIKNKEGRTSENFNIMIGNNSNYYLNFIG